MMSMGSTNSPNDDGGQLEVPTDVDGPSDFDANVNIPSSINVGNEITRPCSHVVISDEMDSHINLGEE